ncbi:MAG: helix-turn-helix transcriptional regulator [Desulfatiglans sp.]|jgi:transcriptional regulator with XRE-family HTH domain|nr:helix-turn-helix transcriptional regulator [Desulfatiglans sp.]
MMAKIDTDWVAMSDRAIISAIGNYIKERRLSINKTQAQIAEKAGINRSTLVKIESGESITLISLIQILRALDSLHILQTFKIEKIISPIELAKIEGRKRQRAREKKKDKGFEESW